MAELALARFVPPAAASRRLPGVPGAAAVRRAVTRLDRPGPHGSAADVTTLPEALRRFLAHPRPPVLLGAVGAVAAVRYVRGPLRRRDAVTAAACLGAQPFVEWAVHRCLLHARPGGALGSIGYQLAGYGHEQHHRDPANLDTMFLRPREVTAGAAAAVAVASLAPPTVGTVAVCLGLGALAYDWTHFLIHTSIRPSSRYYRRVWRGHRLHHYRNEGYWLGVTSPVADLVLGTAPGRDEVPVSPTATGAISRGAARRAPRPAPVPPHSLARPA
ncbi:sterol desaturase family protein [Parafrankia sp. EUN1f]|uniref:sterol desaturase family protein n=1 Tax=Parafrankia sp. EUN1f TaxID=102897 RepID=UPI0001C45A99|nr:sterol desaturase family protein [Parafrankia sp. EUN1f]EFC81993.1 fatty acid hydroxylase [Parafrankia sp. EUN1f]